MTKAKDILLSCGCRKAVTPILGSQQRLNVKRGSMTNPHAWTAVLTDLARMVEVEIAAATLFPSALLPEALAREGSRAELESAVAAELAWVAEVEPGCVVGFLAAQSIGTSLHIVEMDVLPSYGRKGMGALLLQHAAEQCRRLGHNEITLTTFASVPWNAPFYAKYGFRHLLNVSRFAHLTQALARESDRVLRNRVAMFREVVDPPSQAD